MGVTWNCLELQIASQPLGAAGNFKAYTWRICRKLSQLAIFKPGQEDDSLPACLVRHSSCAARSLPSDQARDSIVHLVFGQPRNNHPAMDGLKWGGCWHNRTRNVLVTDLDVMSQMSIRPFSALYASVFPLGLNATAYALKMLRQTCLDF